MDSRIELVEADITALPAPTVDAPSHPQPGCSGSRREPRRSAYIGSASNYDSRWLTAHLTRSPLVLDDQAFAQIATKLDKLLAELERIGAAAERRLKRRDHQGEIRATAVLMLFETPLAGAAIDEPQCHDLPVATADVRPPWR